MSKERAVSHLLDLETNKRAFYESTTVTRLIETSL